MSKIKIIEEKISKDLELSVSVSEDKYSIEMLNLEFKNEAILESEDKTNCKIEMILERYEKIKKNILKEKYKNAKEIFIKEDRISNRKEIYLKSGILYYEIGYKLEKDIAIGISTIEEQVIEKISKFDMDLYSAIDKYEILKSKL